MMKKNIIAAIALGVLLLPVAAAAQIDTSNQGGVTGPTSLRALIYAIERAIALIFSGIAVIMFVIAGILFLTAQGQPDKIVVARQAFIWGVAGVVVGIIAFSIVAIVSSFISGT